MEVSVTLHEVQIIDKDSKESHTVRTLRPVEEIAALIEETEKEALMDHLQEAVAEAYMFKD